MRGQKWYKVIGIAVALALVTVLVMLSFPVPAAAATLTLRPSAAGDETYLNVFGAASNFTAVDEATSDDDTTYVYTTGNAFVADLYNLADTTLSGKGTINSVTVYINARAVNTPDRTSAYTRIETNAVAYDGTAQTVTTAYATYSTVYSTNPQTTNAWTWAEVNALQAGAGLQRASNSNPKDTRVTQVWVVVDYTPVTVWASYDDALRTSAQDTFQSGTNVVYMEGTDFARGDTKVGYYDADSPDNLLVETDTFTGFAGGTLQSDIILNQDWGETPPTGDGTWYAVVVQTSGAMPATYAAAIASSTYVIDDDFYVANSAIPEFPTVIAAVGVVGLCFAIYYRMRKRRLAYVQA